jgi:hypothetical protein
MSREFDRAWYGHRDPGAAGFAGSREQYVRLEEALERGAGWPDADTARGRDDGDRRRDADTAPSGATTTPGNGAPDREPPA